MSLVINPKVDLVFKKIFGTEENKDLLISLINSIVSEADQVVDVEILNPYNAPDTQSGKLSILDIKARDRNGQYYCIEMQVTDTKDYDKRALYYWGKAYTSQLEKGRSYGDLRKTIGIHILYFNSVAGSNYHTKFGVTDLVSGTRYYQDLELHTIELPKFEEKAGETEKELLAVMQTALDMWSAFLTRWDLLQSEPLAAVIKDLPQAKALSVLNHLHLSDSEREVYEERMKWIRDEIAILDAREAKGREERNIEIALTMKEDGMSYEIISKYTGLSIEEIEAL